ARTTSATPGGTLNVTDSPHLSGLAAGSSMLQLLYDVESMDMPTIPMPALCGFPSKGCGYADALLPPLPIKLRNTLLTASRAAAKKKTMMMLDLIRRVAQL